MKQKPDSTKQQAVRLPEWSACLDSMRTEGLTYDAKFTAAFFEKHLRMDRDSVKFKLAISKIRKELEREGFYLTGKGGNGKFWVIVPAEDNSRVMINYGRLALNALTRGVILGTNTPIDILDEDARARHEATLARMATKAALMQRGSEFLK